MRTIRFMQLSLCAALGLFIGGDTTATADDCRRLEERQVLCLTSLDLDPGWDTVQKDTCWCSVCQGSHGLTGCNEVSYDGCITRKRDGSFISVSLYHCLGQGYSCNCPGTGSGS